MKIIIVDAQRLEMEKPLSQYTNEELEKVASYIDSLEGFENDWNWHDDRVPYPDQSYIRIVED